MLTNFCEEALFNNLPILLKDEQNQTFVFNMPTIEMEYGCVYNLSLFIGLCSQTLYELVRTIPQMQEIGINDRLALFLAICKNGGDDSINIITGLNLTMQNFEYVDDHFECNGFVVSSEVFDTFCSYISIACGFAKFDDLKKVDELRRMDPLEREWEERKMANEAKIRKAKNKGGKGITNISVMASAMREFGIAYSDLKKLNKYTLYTLFGYVGSIGSYEIKKMAAANGHLSNKAKFTHWTDNN